MKKNFFYATALVLGLAFTATACSDDDDNSTVNPADIEYNSENAASWHNYMRNVAALLKTDATNLYDSWNTSYKGGASFATSFKAHAVESWYSWHSRDDYTNNIYSIRNAYYGSLDGKVSDKSISKLVAGVNAELDTKVSAAITTAASAIQAIPQPFRNNINSQETVAAIKACEELESVLDKELKPYIRDNSTINSNEALDPIVENYVNVVVLPTYKDLKEKNSTLYDAVVALANNPSNSAFETACNAWITAREPWEESEAFLFGPVDELGLDPNMDSWPLDQNAIVQILNSQKWGDLEWSEGDDDAKVESAQNVRGFHTLEFLLFKDGKPRTVK